MIWSRVVVDLLPKYSIIQLLPELLLVEDIETHIQKTLYEWVPYVLLMKYLKLNNINNYA